MIQNPIKFFNAFINVNTRTIKQLYKQNAKNVVASNYNNNIGWLYIICDPCKITKKGYRSYKIIDKVTMPVILITIFYQKRL